MTTGISIKLPASYDPEDGPFALTKTIPQAIKQNFRNLVMTNPGERVMNSDFGVGIRVLLFENIDTDISERIRERLFDQVNRYMPFIKIIKFETNYDESNYLWNITIKYAIETIGIPDELSVSVADL